MKHLKTRGILLLFISLILVFFTSFTVFDIGSRVMPIFIDKELSNVVEIIFNMRSRAILEQDSEALAALYDRDIKYGIWAYEHEVKRMKYLNIWADKQGIKFIDMKSKPVIRYVKEKQNGLSFNLTNSTEYKYIYENDPKVINVFRIGTYHSLDIEERGESWLITREWYTDPFADSLNLESLKTEEIREHILSGSPKDYSNLLERRENAVKYADQYVGAAGNEETGYQYNKEYINYNSKGGDCANFASQILHEGGGFRKNYSWNYSKGGNRAWVNAQGFKDYWLYSGRASKIAYGSYSQIYKAAYKMEPGDFVAYEKGGKVVHISVVTGTDSKGYPLVNCHNTDRYRVPWDLGWSNKGIRFWLIHVHF